MNISDNHINLVRVNHLLARRVPIIFEIHILVLIVFNLQSYRSDKSSNFLQVRPVVETGYENLLLVRLLLETRIPSIRKSSVGTQGKKIKSVLDLMMQIYSFQLMYLKICRGDSCLNVIGCRRTNSWGNTWELGKDKTHYSGRMEWRQGFSYRSFW